MEVVCDRSKSRLKIGVSGNRPRGQRVYVGKAEISVDSSVETIASEDKHLDLGPKRKSPSRQPQGGNRRRVQAFQPQLGIRPIEQGLSLGTPWVVGRTRISSLPRRDFSIAGGETGRARAEYRLPSWRKSLLFIAMVLVAFTGPNSVGVAALGDPSQPDRELVLQPGRLFGKNQTKYFTAKNRRVSVLRALERSGRYRDFIQGELEAAGLPTDLVYLPLLESEYNPSAVSPAGAVGLWQLMPETARWFGLEVSTRLDERLDPIKSTRAAVRLLKELKTEFGDWSTALAAYNCGRGPIRAVRRGRRSILPRETRFYVPRFASVVKIGRHPSFFGLKPTNESPIYAKQHANGQNDK